MVLGIFSRVVVSILLIGVEAAFGAPVHPSIPLAAQASPQFDGRAATDAWLATVPLDQKAKSDAYFEGGYWLLLWDYLWMAAVLLLLLFTGLAARMRDGTRRFVHAPALQAFAYWVQFAILIAGLSFPLTVYEDFFREHQYGLSNQTFGAWFRDELIGLALALVIGGLVFSGFRAIVRRFERSWHVWCALAATVFTIIVVAVFPVFVAPLFNTYKPLDDQRMKAGILSLARANGIPATDVYQVDASRQSKRVSANVSGFWGTERITLNDNLLGRVSPEGVMGTMGHEMGHYVLNHITNSLLFSALTLLLMFSLLRWALTAALRIWGLRWRVSGTSDVAVLPLAALILLTLNFVFTPIENTFTRTQEYEADLYGLNTARQPDGEAEVDLLLGEYRKLDPSPFEEFLFFDHPSGRTRIYAAMRWKAENLCLFDRGLPCADQAADFTAAPTGPSRSNETRH